MYVYPASARARLRAPARLSASDLRKINYHHYCLNNIIQMRNIMLLSFIYAILILL